MAHRKAAYYARNDSFSRSANAELAEMEGRYPRTRAAAKLGVSVRAFDAGCRAADYVPSEWHHVGKYASRIDYYDCEALAKSPEFWSGAASAYASQRKKNELLNQKSEREKNRRREKIEAFRDRLIAQRDCSRPVPRRNTKANYDRYLQRIAIRATDEQVSAVAHAAIEKLMEPFDGGTLSNFVAPGFKGVSPGDLVSMRKFLHLSNRQFAAATSRGISTTDRRFALRVIGDLIRVGCLQ